MSSISLPVRYDRAAAEQGLAACKEGTQDDDTVNAVLRGVLLIKGGAGAFGYIALQGFTHVFETLLSDGRVALIVDIDSLVSRSFAAATPSLAEAA